MIVEQIISSPVGNLRLVASDDFLLEIEFTKGKSGNNKKTSSSKSEKSAQKAQKILEASKLQLVKYFKGDLKKFNLPVKQNGTEFQKKVWQMLDSIPYGETISYAELAERVKSPKACRAVGSANGKNKLPIILPCHRVIGKNGTLTGFGGGLKIKSLLLKLESQYKSALKERPHSTNP
jgi:methylated-DNA-[protein]-cysteine S-methyltransferase